MHGNPDVSRFVVRVDSFGPNEEPGYAPDAEDVGRFLHQHLNERAPNGTSYFVEVEERLA